MSRNRIRFGVGVAVLGALSLAASDRSHRPPLPTAVRILLDRNRFIPAEIHTHPGDTLRFVNGQGGPHNVMFEKDSIAPAAQKAIDAAIGKQRLYFLAGPILILEGETFTFVVPDLPPGRYPLYCNPHYGQMRGSLIVER